MTKLDEHARIVVQQIADGQDKRAAYADYVQKLPSVTLGELAAFRNAIEMELVRKLQELQKMAYTLRIG